MDKPIPAIETRYNGYRFRSRLEARYAVLLDTLGISYEFEKEGFALPSGWYLPDFWIPSWDAWLEIKGPDPMSLPLKDGQGPVDKILDLVDATKKRVYLAYGDIWPSHLKEEMLSPLVFTPERKYSGWQWWCHCPQCGRTGLAFMGDTRELGCECDPILLHYPQFTSSFILDAFEVARSARFEHGERG